MKYIVRFYRNEDEYKSGISVFECDFYNKTFAVDYAKTKMKTEYNYKYYDISEED